MSQNPKAPSFRGHVRKAVSPFGITSWVIEVRNQEGFTELEHAPTVLVAIARAIETAYDQAQPWRQAA